MIMIHLAFCSILWQINGESFTSATKVLQYYVFNTYIIDISCFNNRHPSYSHPPFVKLRCLFSNVICYTLKYRNINIKIISIGFHQSYLLCYSYSVKCVYFSRNFHNLLFGISHKSLKKKTLTLNNNLLWNIGTWV